MKIRTTSLLTVLSFAILAACHKPNEEPSSTYPKQVRIVYRVSSSTADSLVSITYDNETGGQSTAENPHLPFSKSITKTVNKYDIITLGFFVNPAKPVKLEIILNNQVVKAQDYSVPNAAMSYTFP